MRTGRITRRRAVSTAVLVALMLAFSTTWPNRADASSVPGAGWASVDTYPAGQSATYLTGTLNLGSTTYVVMMKVGGFGCNPSNCPRQTEPLTGTAQAPPALTTRALSGSCNIPWLATTTALATYVCSVHLAGSGTWPVTIVVSATEGLSIYKLPVVGTVIGIINCLVVSPLGGCVSIVPGLPGAQEVYVQTK
jgi:hypothetical protein